MAYSTNFHRQLTSPLMASQSQPLPQRQTRSVNAAATSGGSLFSGGAFSAVSHHHHHQQQQQYQPQQHQYHQQQFQHQPHYLQQQQFHHQQQHSQLQHYQQQQMQLQLQKDLAKESSPFLPPSASSHPSFLPQKIGTKGIPIDHKLIKAPKPPEKPLAAYMRYSRKIWDRVKIQNPDAKMWEIGKIIGQLWRDLPETNKQEFIDEYDAEKVEYERMMKSYHCSPAYQAYVNARSRAQQAQEERELLERSIGGQKAVGGGGTNAADKFERRIDIQPAEDDDDVDDGLTVQQVSHIRFQRNNSLASDIFSDVVVPDVRSVVTNTRLHVLKKQVLSLTMHQKKLENELQQIEDKFETKKRKFLESSDIYEQELKKICRPAVVEEQYRGMVDEQYELLKSELPSTIAALIRPPPSAPSTSAAVSSLAATAATPETVAPASVDSASTAATDPSHILTTSSSSSTTSAASITTALAPVDMLLSATSSSSENTVSSSSLLAESTGPAGFVIQETVSVHEESAAAADNSSASADIQAADVPAVEPETTETHPSQPIVMTSAANVTATDDSVDGQPTATADEPPSTGLADVIDTDNNKASVQSSTGVVNSCAETKADISQAASVPEAMAVDEKPTAAANEEITVDKAPQTASSDEVDMKSAHLEKPTDQPAAAVIDSADPKGAETKADTFKLDNTLVETTPSISVPLENNRSTDQN